MQIELKSFSNLKEIQSIDRLIKQHREIIEKESMRKKHIVSLRNKREDEKRNLLERSIKNNASISSLEESLSTLEKKKNELYLTEDIQNHEKEMDSLSDKIFALMEENEHIESNINDCKQFLTGSLDTLSEIEEEIRISNQEDEKKIDNYNKRIDALLEDTPHELKNSFKRARDKYPHQIYLTRIIDQACEHCRYQLDSESIKLIDQAKLVQTCHQCERLFVPYDA